MSGRHALLQHLEDKASLQLYWDVKGYKSLSHICISTVNKLEKKIQNKVKNLYELGFLTSLEQQHRKGDKIFWGPQVIKTLQRVLQICVDMPVLCRSAKRLIPKETKCNIHRVLILTLEGWTEENEVLLYSLCSQYHYPWTKYTATWHFVLNFQKISF